MTEPGDFVDAALQFESSWRRAEEDAARIGGDLRFYGSSVGAIRGTLRNLGRRYPDLTRDDIVALSSELWREPVFERRLAAVVLLQSNLSRLTEFDLTRIEGFLRSGGVRELVDPLATEVVGPLVETLDARARARADAALDRWAGDGDEWLRRAALMASVGALRAGGGDWSVFSRRADAVLAASTRVADVATEALSAVLEDLEAARPELSFRPHR